LKGIVDEDTVRTQLLYELQGNIYLNSDVKADLSNVAVKKEAENRSVSDYAISTFLT
jgi:hypothetical protein